MSLRAKEIVSPLAFGLFVGLTSIQCRHQGALGFAIALAAGTALAISFALWASASRERRERG